MTVYFDKPGPQNTNVTLMLAKQRALQLGITHMVIATRLGDTALQAAEIFKDTSIKIIAVTHQYGFYEPGKLLISPENQKKLEEENVKVMTSSMIFSALGKNFRPSWKATGYVQYLTMFPFDIVADTLRMFCQGMKVCIEIVLMAADCGAIPIDKDVISIAGTGRGADTAIVVKPTNSDRIFDIRVREIIAKPRQ